MGPWSVSLKVEKGFESGNNTCEMTFKGNHSPDGGVAEFKYAATRDEFLIPKTKTVIHGSPKDQWSLSVEPEPPANGKIKWVVRRVRARRWIGSQSARRHLWDPRNPKPESLACRRSAFPERLQNHKQGRDEQDCQTGGGDHARRHGQSE